MSNISLLDLIKEAKLASNSKDLEKNSIKLENSLDFLKNNFNYEIIKFFEIKRYLPHSFKLMLSIL